MSSTTQHIALAALCVALAFAAWPAMAQQIGPWRGASTIAGGYQYSLGLKSRGRIIAWGNSDYGQTNVPKPNTDFVSVAGGWYHSLGLKSDGSIVAWGDNAFGQLNVPAPNTNFVAMATTGGHSLGLKSDGSVVAWGYNPNGECNVPAPNSNFVAIAGGGEHSLGLKLDGSIVAWGYNFYSQLNVPAPNSNFAAIAGGYYHSLGLKSDGSIIAWGDDVFGQTNVPAPNSDFMAVAPGAWHSLGLKSDGSIVAWGQNQYGQCNVPAPNSNFVAIAGGYVHSLGLKSDGSIVAWGWNNYGQANAPVPNSDFARQSGVMPSGAPLDGGTTVIIMRSNLSNGSDVTNVTLCGVAATIVTQNPWRVVVQTGPAAAPTNGDVVVYSIGYGSITRTNGFTYCTTPIAATLGVTNIAATSVVGAGEVLSDGGDPGIERGLCWGTATNPTVSDNVAASGSGIGVFSGLAMTGLTPDTWYHVRAWAWNLANVAYGSDVPFKTHYAVTTSAGPHGTITPSGIVDAEYGSNITFTITPNLGWHVLDVLVDGGSVGATNRYTFEDVTTNHTIGASFAANNGSWCFAALSDTASADLSSTGIVAEITQAIAADETDLLIFSGDLRDTPILSGFQQWTNVMAPLYQAGIGVYPVRGNHDANPGYDPDSANWKTVFNYLPTNGPDGEVGFTYSITNKNAVFIGLDENVNSRHVNQSWLNTQLASNTAQHVFAFGHMPAFPAGAHVRSSLDVFPTNRDAFWNSLVASGAKAYFCGHEEFYDHARVDDGDGNSTNDVHQYIVGTSGSPFDPDNGYTGDNGLWIPVRQYHTNQYGYVLGEVYGNRVNLTWMGRTSPGVYQAGDSVVLGKPITVTAFAGPHGTITPSGAREVEYGSNITFTITTNAGCHMTDVLVDNVSVGVTNSYTFTNVTSNHTISARFAADNINGRWRFAAVGDTADAAMTSTGIVTEIAQAVAADKPDLLIFLGDQMKPPVLSALQQWTNTMAPVYQAGIGVYPIRGNHDANTNYDPGSTNWMTVYNYLPTNGPPGEVGFTYSVSNMNAVFIGLDENVNSNRVNQEWLNAQLASSTGQHVFVFGHMPAFPTGTQISNSLANYPTNRNAFWSSLAAGSVKACFCGHEHFYDRARIDDGDGNPTNDVHQYIVGTAGSAFFSDSGYVADNGSWTPVRRFHTTQYGYVLGEVYGSRVTLTWKCRTSPGVFQAGDFLVFNDTYTINGTSQAWLDYYGLTNDVSDTDGDGMPDWAEYIAGIDPTDPASRLLVNIGDTPTDVLVSWTNTGNRTYNLWFRPDLLTGSWQSIKAYTNLPSGKTLYTNDLSTNSAFFRLTVVSTNL